MLECPIVSSDFVTVTSSVLLPIKSEEVVASPSLFDCTVKIVFVTATELLMLSRETGDSDDNIII